MGSSIHLYLVGVFHVNFFQHSLAASSLHQQVRLGQHCLLPVIEGETPLVHDAEVALFLLLVSSRLTVVKKGFNFLINNESKCFQCETVAETPEIGPVSPQVLASSQDGKAVSPTGSPTRRVDSESRLGLLKSRLFRAVCRRVCKGLLNRDRLLLALRLTQVLPRQLNPAAWG